jgi:hypothetical protein
MTLQRCKDAFAYPAADGGIRVVTAGTLVEDDDPAVKANPGAFEDVQQFVDRSAVSSVERATAGPGERRTLTKPRGRPPKPAGEG